MITAVIFILFAFAGSIDARECFDEDESCSDAGTIQMCNDATFGFLIKELCPESCGECGTGCFDAAPHCPLMKDLCNVDALNATMENCRETCGLCTCNDTRPSAVCKLTKSKCNDADAAVKKVMSESCAKTCGLCPDVQCVDQRSDCAQYASLCNSTSLEVQDAIRSMCPNTCGVGDCINSTRTSVGYTGWVYGKWFNYWYKFICESLPFDEMEARCVAEGGHLASVISALESQFLAGINQCASNFIWIGLRRNATTNTNHWSDGSAVTYSPSLISCPNANVTTGDCRLLNTPQIGWCSSLCTRPSSAVCKRSPQAVAQFAGKPEAIVTLLFE